MTLLLVLAQIADGMTAGPSHELNPAAAALLVAGLWLPAKLALCSLVTSAAAVLERAHGRLAANALLVVGTVAGIVGTWSNL